MILQRLANAGWSMRAAAKLLKLPISQVKAWIAGQRSPEPDDPAAAKAAEPPAADRRGGKPVLRDARGRFVKGSAGGPGRHIKLPKEPPPPLWNDDGSINLEAWEDRT